MLLVEMAYALAYSSKRLFLTRWLLLPLAAYYWSVFGRIALAEQRLRTGKGKRISWEEYGCIYLPFALKAGFLAASACINATAMVTVDYGACAVPSSCLSACLCMSFSLCCLKPVLCLSACLSVLSNARHPIHHSSVCPSACLV